LRSTYGYAAVAMKITEAESRECSRTVVDQNRHTIERVDVLRRRRRDTPRSMTALWSGCSISAGTTDLGWLVEVEQDGRW
jgi:hypothetical protein